MPDPARRLLTIERPPGAEPVMKIDGHEVREHPASSDREHR